ncbi:MAG TPA: hypothetical protein VK205_01340 [Prolixibacteraceae bacterium]|nr:hypothetical protein [Prolixibacteraceae bacterium]
MKTTVACLLVLLLTGIGMAGTQSRFPIKATSVWRVNYEFPRYEWSTHANGDEEYKYFIGGDTLVGGKQYFKLMKSGVLYLDTPFKVVNKYMGAIRDSENKFYFVAKNSERETLLYDFDVPMGEYIPDRDGTLRQVSEIEMLDNGRKKYSFDFMTVHCGAANTVIEGIGWLGGLLEGNSCSGHPGVRGAYLVCYAEEGLQVYQSPTAQQYELSCSDPFTSVEDPLPQGLHFSRNATRINVSLPGTSRGMELAGVYNILGEKVMEQPLPLLQEYSLNIGFLEPGIYVLKILSNGKPFMFKFGK